MGKRVTRWRRVAGGDSLSDKCTSSVNIQELLSVSPPQQWKMSPSGKNMVIQELREGLSHRKLTPLMEE